MVISHDRHMLRSVTDRWLWVDGGCVTPFDGDLESYRQQMIARRDANEAATVSSADMAGEKRPVTRKARRQQEAEERRALKPLQNRLKKLEQQLERLNGKKEEIEALLAESAIYSDAEKGRLKELLAAQASLSAELDEVEEAWMAVSESLEAQGL